MDQIKIGKFIAECRKSKNITQLELGERLGVSKNAVSKWERGISLPDISIMQELCSYLGISLNELFNGEANISDNGIITYLKEEKRKRKLKLIISVLTTTILILLALLSIYFINNYNKINVYILSGESENFSYSDNVFIKSNIANINSYGYLDIKNKNIKEENIISIAYYCNGELISSGGGIFRGTSIEKNGYDELFPKEVRDNIDKWSIEITYLLNNKQEKEIINLKADNILKNDSIAYNKVKKITNNSSTNISYWKKNKENHLLFVKDELLKKGYTVLPIQGNATCKDTIDCLVLKKDFDDGSYMKYRARIGRWEYYSKENIQYHGTITSKYIKFSTKENVSTTCYYDILKDKILKCNNDYLDSVRRVKDIYYLEFNGLYYFTENETLDD